jgi:hypothetical protein
MRIDCRHGYFLFYPQKPDELSRLQSIFEIELVPVSDYYTFKDLEHAKDYSIEGADYLGNEALVTYHGNVWEVFKQNGLVYDFQRKIVVPISSISIRGNVSLSLFGFLSSGLLMPGTVREDGQRVKEYSAWYQFETQTFKYQWVQYG